MARTSLGPRIFDLYMGSSSHRELISEPGQEAKVDNLRMSYRSSITVLSLTVLIRRF